MKKRDNWFVDYQSIEGTNGFRQLDTRTNFFNNQDFVDATVIDIGCNLGQMCKYACDLGCKKVIGIDYDTSVISKGRNIFKDNNRIALITADIENSLLYADGQTYDVVLFLSVIDTQELEQREILLCKLFSITDKVLYFEGHNSMKYYKYMNMILRYTCFPFVEYNGETTDSLSSATSRPFITCRKLYYSSDTIIHKLLELLLNNNSIMIGVGGVSGSGKSYIRNKLIELLSEKYVITSKFIARPNIHYYIINNICILDDQPKHVYEKSFKGKYDKLIYFDYKVDQYEPNLEYYVYICPTLDIASKVNHRPPTLYTLKNLKGLYTVKPHMC